MALTVVATGALTGVLILGTVVVSFIGLTTFLNRRFCPLRKLDAFRVRRADGVDYSSISRAMIGDQQGRTVACHGTLSFAMDSDWVYLRSTSILFFPRVWRLPRKKVRRHEHRDWDTRINAVEPPLNARLGSEFHAALAR